LNYIQQKELHIVSTVKNMVKSLTLPVSNNIEVYFKDKIGCPSRVQIFKFVLSRITDFCHSFDTVFTHRKFYTTVFNSLNIKSALKLFSCYAN